MKLYYERRVKKPSTWQNIEVHDIDKKSFVDSCISKINRKVSGLDHSECFTLRHTGPTVARTKTSKINYKRFHNIYSKSTYLNLEKTFKH